MVDRGSAVGSGDGFERTWARTDLSLAAAREAVRTWLGPDRPGPLVSIAELVVTELLTNAREASGPDDEVLLRLSTEAGEVVVEVESPGRVFRPDPAMPGPEARSGRGLALVSAVTSCLEVHESETVQAAESPDTLVRVRARIPLT